MSDLMSDVMSDLMQDVGLLVRMSVRMSDVCRTYVGLMSDDCAPNWLFGSWRHHGYEESFRVMSEAMSETMSGVGWVWDGSQHPFAGCFARK